MDLDDFEEYIDEVILDRGLSYYEDGNVISLKNDDGTWSAVVEGTHDYNVKITIAADGEITDAECDCPYDMGEFCKHQAAVLYAIMDEPQDHIQEDDKVAEGPIDTENMNDILGRLDRETLASIVAEFAGRDEGFKEEMVLRHSEKTDILRFARSIIKDTVRVSELYGYVTYSEERATDGAEKVLRAAEEKIRKGNIRTAVSLCIIIAEGIVGNPGRRNAPVGYGFTIVGEAIRMIGKALSDPAAQYHSEELFDTVYNHSMNRMYDNMNWRIEMLFTLVPLCGIQANRNRLEKLISDQTDRDNHLRVIYDNERMQMLQHEIIKRFDGDAAADSYIERHPDNSMLRFVAIENAMRKGSYGKVIELCTEGEIMDCDDKKLLKRYRDIRYQAYVKIGDTEAQKALGLRLLVNGDREYLPLIKPLYKEDEWPPVLDAALNELRAGGREDICVEIFIKEGLKAKLLEYCSEHPPAIASHYVHLLPEYKEDVCMIFARHIRESAARAQKREEYRAVCGHIRKYKKICGPDSKEIRDELMKKYTRRPAFTDELRKL